MASSRRGGGRDNDDDDDGDSGGGGGGGGGGGSSYDPAKEAKKLAKKAAERYEKQAESLRGQLTAQALAINTTFKQALTQRFANIKLNLQQTDADLMRGFGERSASLTKAADDNSKAAGDQSALNRANRARERTAQLQQAALNGAGESDTLKASLMATRNWSTNQTEVNRSLFDTLRTINQSQTDLNVDTRTARINAIIKANSDKDAAYTDYANRMAEAYTQMGNITTQQAELYGLANEQREKDEYEDKQEASVKAADRYFLRSAQLAGAVYKNPGVSDSIRNWRGLGERTARSNTSRFAEQATDIQPRKKPEGATLRKWDEEAMA